jgi:O-antigen/teichoic acid export membrane protein
LSFLCEKLKTLKIISRNKHTKELVKGSAIALVFKAAGIIIQYIFFWLIARYFNATGVGVFSLLWTILIIAAVFSKLGFDTALVRIIPTLIEKNNRPQIPKLYQQVIRVVFFASIVIGCLLIIFANQLSSLFFQSKDYFNYFLIISITVIPLSILNLNAEVFKSFKKITLFSSFQNASIFVIASIIIWIGNLKFNHINIVFIAVAVATISLLSISIYYLVKLFRKEIKTANAIEFNLSPYYKMALPMLLTNSLFLIMNWTDTIMLGSFLEESKVGVYNVALKISALTTVVLVGVNSIAMPKYAELYASNNMDELKYFAKRTSLLTFSLSSVAFLIIIIFPEFLLGFFGEEFIQGKSTLFILSSGMLFCTFSGSSILLLNMTGKEIASRNILIVTVIINIVLNLILIPQYEIQGAAIATASSTILWNLLAVIVIYKNFRFLTYPFNIKKKPAHAMQA